MKTFRDYAEEFAAFVPNLIPGYIFLRSALNDGLRGEDVDVGKAIARELGRWWVPGIVGATSRSVPAALVLYVAYSAYKGGQVFRERCLIDMQKKLNQAVMLNPDLVQRVH